ncbi:MAG TPA: UDP-4-amino-4,6-dideoxy-N-acetyl-beta-L-altrosamine transaminase [Fibrobacteria bacterium]|nr:UDP-4-amino-4,6-dideoxy-N-acetyl-beta-L-altrosamine transaminase [Fibrobacteria bacterium]
MVATLQSDWLTQGPAVERFEKGVAAYCGAGHAVAVSSATAALHVACLAAGLGPGDVCWTSPNSFVASANCALYCGARVDFVDVLGDTYNMDPALLEAKLERARGAGRLPKVVIPVHFAGQSCRMDLIGALAARYGFTVIEDASHAIGGSFAGAKVGGCAHSSMTVFSFHPVKIITTGEGGMVTTNDPVLKRKLERLRSHGITREEGEMHSPSHGPWYYEQIELGFNYRITDVQAALGLSQLARIDEFIARRAALADLYDGLLRDLPVAVPHRDPLAASAWHLYPIRLDPSRGAPPRDRVFAAMRKGGIGVNVHYLPIPAQPYYRGLGFSPEGFPSASAYYANAISLPLFADLTRAQAEKVVELLKTQLI